MYVYYSLVVCLRLKGNLVRKVTFKHINFGSYLLRKAKQIHLLLTVNLFAQELPYTIKATHFENRKSILHFIA